MAVEDAAAPMLRHRSTPPLPRCLRRRERPTPVALARPPASLGGGGRRVRCWCAVLLVLSLLDLWLTLLHLRAGGGELNPWMDWCHRAGGEAAFSAAKIAATVFGVGVLAWHARHDLVRHAVHAVVVVYSLVLVWHGVVALAAPRMAA